MPIRSMDVELGGPYTRDGAELVREERKITPVLWEFSYYYATVAQLLSRILYSVGFRCSLETVCLRERERQRRQDRGKNHAVSENYKTFILNGSEDWLSGGENPIFYV